MRHYLISLVAGSEREGANLFLDARGAIERITLPFQEAEARRQRYPLLSLPPVPPNAPHRTGSAEHEVAFPGGKSGEDVTLAGTLLIPAVPSAISASRVPVVIFVTGSGPQDRDKNSPGSGGLKGNIFRDIAEHLSNHGIATLRYDDRGVGKSTGNFAAASLSDLVRDLEGAVLFARRHPLLDPSRVFLLGHSEGGIIAPMVATTTSEIFGVILMAGTAASLDRVVEEQVLAQARLNRAAPEILRRINERMRKQIAFVKRYKPGDPIPPSLYPPRAAVRFPWLQEHYAHDPTATITRLHCPILILNGAKDLQVLPHHARDLARALDHAGHRQHTVYIFPGLDHLFMRVTPGLELAEYGDPWRRIDPILSSTILRWIQARVPMAGDSKLPY